MASAQDQHHTPPGRELITFSASLLRYLKSIGNSLSSLPAAQYDDICNSIKKGAPDLKGFLQYISSPEGNAMGSLKNNDLNYPISHYFISTSHNTYLSASQLYGSSSAAAYETVLLKGCRCVEIDVWDGDPNELEKEGDQDEKQRKVRPAISKAWSRISGHGEKSPELSPPAEEPESTRRTRWRSASSQMQAEPMVFHGYTLTKPVPFRAIAEVVKRSAFVTSQMPLIVSLEIHLSVEQQHVLVDIMHEVWKGILVDEADLDCKHLPSPASLQGKILIKVKGAKLDPSKAARTEPVRRSSSTSSSSGSEKAKVKKPPKSHIVDKLSKLGVYTKSYHFTDLTAPEAKIPNHVFSLSERKLMDIHENHGPTLFAHNKDFLMRAYPAGRRVLSSNLDASVYWRKGVQMVALNWQNLDAAMMLNEAMFSGTPGWVLKPKSYRGSNHHAKGLNVESRATSVPHSTLDLSIKVFAAQNLPLSAAEAKADDIHPRLKVELHRETPAERSGEPIENGGRSKGGDQKRRTGTCRNAEPDFGGEVISFQEMEKVVEELTFVRFKLEDDRISRNIMLAWACIRLDRLRTGLRLIHLFDANGEPSAGLLLVEISKALR